MNESEIKTFELELCKRWKGKFNRSDLDFWAMELRNYAMPEVIEALTKFRNSSRFVPKPAEIVKLLPRRTNEAATSKDEGSFADVLRRQNRQYAGRCDAEVYLRYYRSLWITYGNGNRNLDAMKRKITGECVINLVCAQMPEAEAKRAVDFVFDTPEMFRLLLNDLRESASAPAAASTEHVFT